jgi:4-hydroxy-tetrahydrodipicolinate synthase
MDTIRFHGMIPPIATPMHADGSLNLAAMSAVVEHVLVGGVHGIFTPGSQGEAYALDANERCAVIESVVAAVNGRVPVIAGTGAIATRDAIRLSQDAERAGADAIAAVTPFYIAPTQNEIYTYYAEIAAAVSVPVFGYSNPSRTGGVKIAPDTLARLAADIPHFIGVKDSSGDLAETAAILRACPDEFRVFVGRDTLIYGALCYGAAGAVGLTMNVNPAAAVGIYDAFLAGDHAGALRHQETIAILRTSLPRFGTYPVWVKEALNLMGIPVGPARKPVQPLDEAQRAELRAFLESVGIL